MKIRLLKKGIKIDGLYFPVFYSSSKGNCNGNATIYIKSYKSLPAEAYKALNVENNTDMITDYFERDRIRISPSHELFNQVEALAVH